jgi:hypothetical protein
MVIRTGLYFAEQLRLLARKGLRKILPLPAVSKKINGGTRRSIKGSKSVVKIS